MLPVTPDLWHGLTSPLTWAFFAFGAILGSFFNVCVYRIPRGIFWYSARSRCPHCEAVIPAYLNIPIVSWIILRGRTACCNQPLSWQYPAIELATALMFALLYWHFPFFRTYLFPEATPPNLAAWLQSIDAGELMRFLHAATLGSLLIIMASIDIQHYIIPDVISLPMLFASPLVAWLHPDLTLTGSALGILIGGGMLYAIAWVYVVLRKEEGLGFGDVKLLAALGGWLGYTSILPTIIYASLSGTLVGISLMAVRRSADLKIALPFGPFLALGAMLFLLYGTHGLPGLF